MAFKASDSCEDGNIPVITSSNLLADSVLSDFSNFQAIKSLPVRSPAVVNDNDLLMVSRATPGASFKVSLVKTSKPLVAASSVFILRVKSNSILPEFLNHHLNSSAFQRMLAEKAKGSTIIHLTKMELEKLEVPVPSLKTQKEIIALKESIKKQISIHKRQQELKEQAMQAVFNNLYNGKNNGNNNTARA